MAPGMRTRNIQPTSLMEIIIDNWSWSWDAGLCGYLIAALRPNATGSSLAIGIINIPVRNGQKGLVTVPSSLIPLGIRFRKLLEKFDSSVLRRLEAVGFGCAK